MVSSNAKTVKEVLERDKVVLQPEDLVEPSVDSTIDTAVFYINVYRAKPAIVVDGGKEIKVNTPYQSPKLIAERSAGLGIDPDDGFRMELIRDFLGTGAVGQRVVVLRSVPININVDGSSFETRTLESSVGAVLSEKGIKLSDKDTINHASTAAVTPGMQITVTRVGEEITATQEVIARPVRFIYDGNQPTSYEKVQEEGSDGKRLVTYKIVRHNGQVVERTELQSVIEVEPKTRVVVKGTQRTEVAGADWAGLRFCESGGNYANKRNPTYRGAYQFSYSTWKAMGGSGDPADAPPAEQDARASALYQRSGRGQWPVCGPRYLP